MLPLLFAPAAARADRGFGVRFSTNASGDIAMIGNTLQTCPDSAPDCASARDGNGPTLNNNGFVTGRVSVDPGTLDSSSARLRLPDGARVLFAALYYGARTTAGTRGKAAPDQSAAALRTVDLRVPGRAGFDRLTGELDESSEVKGAYGVFVDVTDQVRGAGPGEYTVANVQSATGEDRYAGWAMVIAYEAPGDPPRNLTVFDGLQAVTQGQPALTIPVSGFQTPLSGPVRTRLGFIGYEGDLGLSGDSAALDGKPLTDAVNPPKNFFNSGISIDGQPVTAKTPDYINQLGFDAKLIRIDGVLSNGATSAKIALKTSSDQYLPQAITFATDLYAPVIRATKTVANLTDPAGPIRPGDAVRYTVGYRNEGLEAAADFVAEDVLPPGVTYVPGSLQIVGAETGFAHPSDVTGDDLGEYDGSIGAVRFFLGPGAAPGRGGELAAAGNPGDGAEIRFDARVDPDVHAGREITDVAQARFVASTLGKELGALSSPATFTVAEGPASPPAADLTLTDSETVAPDGGGHDTVDDHIVIDNHGPDDATDVVIHDTAPPGADIESAVPDQGSCSATAADLTCELPRLDAGGSADVNVVEQEASSDGVHGSQNEATVVAPQFDPTPGNNSSEAAVPPPSATPGPSADLDVDVHHNPTTVPLGGELTETITIHNDGPGPATGVDITDIADGPAQLDSIRPGAAACPRTVPLTCSIADLAAGTSATITLKVRPLRPGRLTDAVSVSGDQRDPTYANNNARSVATVNRSRTIAKVRVTPIQPVANRGERVGFVIVITLAKHLPGLNPVLCTRLPTGLRFSSAPGARRHGRTVCWTLRELLSGKPHTLHLYARVRAPRGTSLRLSVSLTGTNFPVRHAAATVQIPPRPTACEAQALTGSPPRATIAC